MRWASVIPGPEARRRTVVTLVFIAFCVLLKLPTLGFPHNEGDEVIYWELTENLVSSGRYSLEGTEVLGRLSPHIYDRPLFHHPPLFALLLAPFVLIQSQSGAVVVSWLGHVLCIAGVALLGTAIADYRKLPSRPLSTYFILPLLGVTLDPFLTFVSRKLWLDGVLAGLVTLSVALCFRSTQSKREGPLAIAAGATLGLAILVKISALVICPVLIFIVVYYARNWRQTGRLLLRGALTAIALVSPWFIVFYAEFGTLMPSWFYPDAWLIETNPFVRKIVTLPLYYYPVQLVLLQPLVLVLAFACVVGTREIDRRTARLALIWMGSFLLVMTLMGMRGLGYQTRYLSAAYPSMYVMLFSLRTEPDTVEVRWSWLLALLCIIYAGINGALFLVIPEADEISSVLELLGIVSVEK